jgi:hypothetical protein
MGDRATFNQGALSRVAASSTVPRHLSRSVADTREAVGGVQVDNLAASQHDEAWVAETVKATLQATKQVLEQGAAGAAGGTLAGKKSLYLRLGARGDWPNLMPPGWDPDNPEVIPDIKMPPT